MANFSKKTKEYKQLHLTETDSNIFIQALFNPPKPSENLMKAAQRYKRMLNLDD